MKGVVFSVTKRTDPTLLELMKVHYSQPKGFVGRNICYAIRYDDIYFGHIVGGSACKFLPGRDEFLFQHRKNLNSVVNNIFYHVEKVDGKYPIRNFTSEILEQWEPRVVGDWQTRYGDSVLGLESLVELPRSGETYRRAGWTQVGITKGFTCKRTAGEGSDSWGGKRVWDTKTLRPKLVFCKKSLTQI